MPILFKEHIQNQATIIFWLINESENDLLRLYPIKSEQKEISQISHSRVRMEALAARLCIYEGMREQHLPFHGIFKDEHGKPLLVDSPAHISYAHSFPVAAGIISTQGPTGIDFELPKEKLYKLRTKYLSKTELTYMEDSLEKLCICWAAKETLYKIYGRKEVLFKQHLFIKPFEIQQQGIIETHVLKDHFDKRFLLEYRKIEGGYLCYNLP